jgi:hypothetical protein
MIVWGGIDQNQSELDTGGRYNPTTDAWISTSTTNAPDRRSFHLAIWTGTEMIVWAEVTPRPRLTVAEILRAVGTNTESHAYCNIDTYT